MNLWNLWIAEDFEQFWRSLKGFYTWNSMTRSKGFGVFFFKSWLWLTLVKTYIWEFSWKSVLAMPCKKKDSGCVVAVTIVSDYQIILVQATSRHKHNRIFKERWAWTGGKKIIHLIYNIIYFISWMWWSQKKQMDIQVPTLCRVLRIHTHPNTKKKLKSGKILLYFHTLQKVLVQTSP